MSTTADAWDDEWSTAADDSVQAAPSDLKKPSTKQTKAQKRAAQAEFNRQLWAEAEGPREPNYFLESQNVVPLRQEFKAAPVLLSRKGPVVQKPRSNLEGPVSSLILNNNEESSEDEDEETAKQKALDKAKLQAVKDREEKQRKYEERRLELFGPEASVSSSGRPHSPSGGSSPANLTPPGSRSSTPHRGGKRSRGRGSNKTQPQQHQPQPKDIYDPGYSAKPNSTYLMRREQGQENTNKDLQPTREPKAPDGSAGFILKKKTILQGNAPIFHI